ncbi:MAG TPA: ABC transporter permease, partial [Chryseolinea sp.]|nr:ABC transporter permease [Chryseolinea sp.]
MIRNYIRVMYRNITRHKLYATINIVCLTAGMSFALMIGAFTWTELRVNQSLEDIDQLYFVESVFKNNNGNGLFTPAPLLPRAMDVYPDLIQNYFRF